MPTQSEVRSDSLEHNKGKLRRITSSSGNNPAPSIEGNNMRQSHHHQQGRNATTVCSKWNSKESRGKSVSVLVHKDSTLLQSLPWFLDQIQRIVRQATSLAGAPQSSCTEQIITRTWDPGNDAAYTPAQQPTRLSTAEMNTGDKIVRNRAIAYHRAYSWRNSSTKR